MIRQKARIAKILRANLKRRLEYENKDQTTEPVLLERTLCVHQMGRRLRFFMQPNMIVWLKTIKRDHDFNTLLRFYKFIMS